MSVHGRGCLGENARTMVAMTGKASHDDRALELAGAGSSLVRMA
jgi:hypothetical protein